MGTKTITPSNRKVPSRHLHSTKISRFSTNNHIGRQATCIPPQSPNNVHLNKVNDIKFEQKSLIPKDGNRNASTYEVFYGKQK